MKLFTYLIECSLALGAFYSVYFVFLRKQTHFTTNRFYLLFTLVFSMILPSINIRIPVENSEAMAVFRFKEVVIVENTHALQSIISLNVIIALILGLSSSYFLFRLLKQLWLIRRLVRNNQSQKFDNMYVVDYDQNTTFSFFKYIFINPHIENFEKHKILLHEKVHVQHWHTVDKLISELVLISQWFNPFAWLYRNAIGETHEYLADRAIYKYGVNKLEYQQLLLNHMFGTNRIQFVQYFNFNQSLIKKRMIMMTKNEHTKPLKIRFLIALPLTAIIVVLFSFKSSIPAKASAKEVVVNTLKLVKQAVPKDTNTYVVVDENAKFQGGDFKVFQTYLMQNMKYPAEAKKKGIQGKVIVQFVVDVDGSVTGVKILRGLNAECDAEAIRIVQSAPKWEPAKNNGVNVRQLFVLPIVYALQEKDGKK